MLKLRVVESSDQWLVVDKPARFHTHPPEDKQLRILPRWNALGILERQFNQHLYPIHRLDRAASGLLLYSRKKEINRPLHEQFSRGEVLKTYYVVARGKIEGEIVFDKPLKSESGAELTCFTKALPCFSFSLPIPHPHGGDRAFTVLAVTIGTGRFHQIRRHFAQAGFPLVGDSRHGDKKLNRLFASLTGCDNLFLRCMFLEFHCPVTGKKISTSARWSRDWHRLFDVAGACALTK